VVLSSESLLTLGAIAIDRFLSTLGLLQTFEFKKKFKMADVGHFENF